MILNNVHDLSSIFLCIDESRLELFFLFAWSTQHDSNSTQSYTCNEYTSQTPTTEDRNVGMECFPYICSSVLFFFCSIYFWSQRNNFNERLFFLIIHCTHSNPSSIYKLLLTYSDGYLFMKCQLTFLFFLISFSLCSYKW